MATTQQSHPWRAAARTAAQALVTVPAVLGAVAAVLVVVGESDALPPAWAAWAAATAVTVSALAGLLARIMAIPAVDSWLARWRLSSAPEGSVSDTDALADYYRRLTLEITRDRPSAPPERETCLDALVERADQTPDRPTIGFRSMDPEDLTAERRLPVSLRSAATM